MASSYSKIQDTVDLKPANRRAENPPALHGKPIHGDYHPRNIIVAPDLTTVIDFEEARMGDPAFDVGTAEAVAVGCTHCGNCERGRGCQVGITTTDPELSQLIDPEWGEKRIVNLFNAWSKRLRIILSEFGLGSIRELRGRKDLLVRYK